MADELKISWSMSTGIGKLVEALAKAQSKFDPVLKENSNPAFHSKYADLATVIGATQKHLSANGLVVIQMPHAEFGENDSKLLTLTTVLAHASGEWMTSDLTLPAMMRERFDAQSVGSAITYARRYAWSAMTGVAQEDDDGNKAAGVGSKEAAQAVATKILKSKANGEEKIELIPAKDGKLIVKGNGLSILRANLTEEQKLQFFFKMDMESRNWTIPEAQGNLLASLCEKQQVKCIWVDSQAGA